jgi:hypothetical protein
MRVQQYRRVDSHFWWMSLILLLGTLSDFTRSFGQDAFPRFLVPGHEAEMEALNDLHALHHEGAFTTCTLWDSWLPHATLWASEKKRTQYREAFVNRRIDEEGYVSMQQHRGMAHSEGWPFPAWQQSTGVGFHFSNADDVWAIQNFGLKALTDTDGWEISGAEVLGIDPAVGLRLRASGDAVTITTPSIRCGTIVAPFLRLEWQTPGVSSRVEVEWLLEGEAAWSEDRSYAFATSATDRMRYQNIPLYRQPGYAGILKRYRLRIETSKSAEINLKSMITAIDTRHPITGALFIRGCSDYFRWTGDVEFLKENLERMRRAMRFTLSEFSVEKNKHVFVPWVGHGGRSGLQIRADGTKTARPGLGVGNNYWDLLPFGGHDAMATIYLHDALKSMAFLESSAAKSGIGKPDSEMSPQSLLLLASVVRNDFQTRFWNEETQRFVGWIDVDGTAYDYGFTFLNLESIHYGLASQEQSGSILRWLDGQREVDGDTSQGEDIYHWRFGPRATTRRNIETYVWPWFNPDQIPWGNQVQDGGAVLGFSYFDLMARLKTRGPDDAWNRLQQIIDWYQEVQGEGSYRNYYAKPGRGTLQGGGPPGGLGVDREFLESVLVPQVMLYGFMGVEPACDGIRVVPRLPKSWPELTITNIRFQDHLFDVTADEKAITIRVHQAGKERLIVLLDADEERELRFDPPGPRIECDDAQLDRARDRISRRKEPFFSYWSNALADVETAKKLVSMPYTGSDPLAFHGAAQTEGTAARLLAYAWQLSDDEHAGLKAIDLLDHWAGQLPLPGTTLDPKIRYPNAGMDVARGMLPFVAAFDLLKSNPALTTKKRHRIEGWFRAVSDVVKDGVWRWEKNGDFGGQEFQNHHAAHVLGLVMFGAALDDEELIRFATDSPENPKDFKELVAGLILMPGDRPHGGLHGKPLHAGELQDRSRTSHGSGLSYCHLSLTLMLYTADVLTRVTGEDWINWTAPGGENLQKSATFYSDFFRLRNARINGDYYFRDHRALQNNTPFLGTFEVALSHWPDVPNLKAIVRSMDRSRTPRSWLCYYGLPLLTHGVSNP